MAYGDTHSGADLLDIRTLIEEIESLESQIEDMESEIADMDPNEDDTPEQEKLQELRDELAPIASFVEEFKGYGGDHQWRGDWYPVTFIADSYFVEAMEEEVKDLGYVSEDLPWFIKIDWEATAHNMQQDYTSGEYEGVTYWAR